MRKIYASTLQEMSEREKRNMEKVRRLAPEGMVLFENDGTLPLQEVPKQIALFGSGVRKTVKGGTGSGGVNCRETYNVEQGFEAAGIEVLTKAWLDRFDEDTEIEVTQAQEKIRKQMAENGKLDLSLFMKLFARPSTEPVITEMDVENAPSKLAVYVLARNSGEGNDRKAAEGDYELTVEEKENIKTLVKHYEKVILVLNVGGVIDTKFIRTSGVNAVLLMSQPGNMAGHVLADVLTGKAYPCGHLTTTWAENYMDYPNAAQFSHMNDNLDDEYYEEGIYVGYRYFDSYNITPAYPFGYGLSYTDFAIQVFGVKVEDGQVKLAVHVKNTGSYVGKEVVQVYYSAPEGKLDKAYQKLAAFYKTRELKPQETEEFEIAFALADMASYDEAQAAYILEQGEYAIRMGNHSRNTHVVAVLKLAESVQTYKTANKLSVDVQLNAFPDKESCYSYPKEAEELSNAVRLEISANEVTICNEKKSNFDNEVEEYLSGLSVEELASICVGTQHGGAGSDAVIGAASHTCPGAAGETTLALFEKKGLTNMVLADGPAGLRLNRHFVTDQDGNWLPNVMDGDYAVFAPIFGVQLIERPADAIDYYQYCTAIPIATMLAQTWNTALIEATGDIIGEEMEEFGVHILLAPGMNIHRNPLCGRNFEYYSEDPLVSGKCAAAETRGVQKHAGKGTCIKHFALNNQEDNRFFTNAHCGERAIREIYLKGFEIAVKEAQPLAIMSSYNLLNGCHTANSKELLTDICRDEWGFQGMIMTDWDATSSDENDAEHEKKYSSSDAAECIVAGNDLIMPGSPQDIAAIVAGVEKGRISMDDLRTCAGRVVKTVLVTSA